MNVRETIDLGEGHLIEIGDATWNESVTSVRNRYPTATGGFSPRSSSEIPLGDIVSLALVVAERDLFSVGECAELIEMLAKSMHKRLRVSE